MDSMFFKLTYKLSSCGTSWNLLCAPI